MNGYYASRILGIFNWYCKPYDLVEEWTKKELEFKIELPEDGKEQLIYNESLNQLKILTRSPNCPRLYLARGQNYVKVVVLDVEFPSSSD